MSQVAEGQHIKQALRSLITTSNTYSISVGQSVRAFRETDNRMLGQFEIQRIEYKQEFLDQNGRVSQYNISRVITAPHAPVESPTFRKNPGVI